MKEPNATLNIPFEHRRLRNWVLLISLLLSLAVIALAGWLARSAESDALLRSSQIYSDSLTQFRAFYSDVVVSPLMGHPWVEITENYKDVPGSIPIPATMTLDLVDFINDQDARVQLSLVSDFPFPDRADRLLTDFERQALDYFALNSQGTFHQVETLDGQAWLSYATPIPLEASCVSCHNNHAHSPFRDWKAGDVRGIQVVSLPITDLEGGGNKRLALFAGLILAFLLLGAGILLWMDRRITGAVNLAREKSLALEKTADALRQRQFAMDQHSIISITDAAGRITYANDLFVKISGYTRDELLGENHRLVNSGLHSKAFFKDLWETVAGGQVWHGEVRNQKKNGEFYWVAATVVPFLDRKGRPEQYISIRTDITQQKSMEASLAAQNQSLLEAKQAAEQASLAKSQFLANMSHEIRTPMNGILGMTELALDTPLDSTQRDYLQLVHSSAESLLCLLNDILDFSKIEAGKLDIDIHEFSLNEFLTPIIKSQAIRCHQKGLTFVWDLAPDLPDNLYLDSNRLRQMTNNLIDNAIKFTQSGEIVVRVQWQADEADLGTLVLQVEDTGVGIQPEKLESIFQAFTQADASTTRQYGGTGLGLAICLQLARLMGGVVEVSSEVGQGSCFQLRLPARAKMIAHRPELTGRVSVMLLDPHPVNRRVHETLLSALGAKVFAPVNHSVALADNSEVSVCPQAIFIKHQPPDFDAFALVQVLLERWPEAHLVVMSPAVEKGELQRAQQLGVAALHTWPLSLKELYQALLPVASQSVKSPQTPDLVWSYQKIDAEILNSLAPVLLEQGQGLLKELQQAFESDRPDLLRSHLVSWWSNLSLLEVHSLAQPMAELIQQLDAGLSVEKLRQDPKVTGCLASLATWLQQLAEALPKGYPTSSSTQDQ